MKKILAVIVGAVLLSSCQKINEFRTYDANAKSEQSIKSGQMCLKVGGDIMKDMKQIVADTNDAQLQKLVAEHDCFGDAQLETVEQAEQVQIAFEKFVVELLALSETNDNAKKIIDKYQIRKGAPE